METNNKPAVGNVAKLRETLDEIRVAAMSDYEPDADYLINTCNAALSAPPRNCDVGTANEQYERWQVFCGRYDNNCTGCPCDDGCTCNLGYCFSKWAQMPYEEGGAK